jgi:uncharacterized membrane protein YdjX (TVP38/TMEM64 family)
VVRIAGLALILAVASFGAYRLGLFDYRHVAEHISALRRSDNSPLFRVLFILVYAGATSVGVPALPLTVAAGVLFGAMPGVAFSWVGAILGAAIGYVIARTVGHDTVLRWIKRRRRLVDVVDDTTDFRGILRLRLIPVLPVGAVSFAAGLAKAPFAPYLAATAVGLLPATIVYSYFADRLVAGISGGEGNALVIVLVASALLIGLSLLPRARWSRAISNRSGRDG